MTTAVAMLGAVTGGVMVWLLRQPDGTIHSAGRRSG